MRTTGHWITIIVCCVSMMAQRRHSWKVVSKRGRGLSIATAHSSILCSPAAPLSASSFLHIMTHPSQPPLLYIHLGIAKQDWAQMQAFLLGCVQHRDSPASAKTRQFHSVICVSNMLLLLLDVRALLHCRRGQDDWQWGFLHNTSFELFFSDQLIAFQRRDGVKKKTAKNLQILNTGWQNKICNVLHIKWVQKMDK